MKKLRKENKFSYYEREHHSSFSLFLMSLQKTVRLSSTSDKISFFGIIISAILAVVGLQLTERISRQEQNIKGFDSLLHVNKIVIQNLNTQLAVLSKQLSLNEATQRRTSYSDSLMMLSDRTRLWIAANTISSIADKHMLQAEIKDGLHYLDYSRINDMLTEISAVFKVQLQNPALISDGSLYKLWNQTFNYLSAFLELQALNTGGQLTIASGGLNNYPYKEKLLDSLSKSSMINQQKRWPDLFYSLTFFSETIHNYMRKHYKEFSKEI